MSNKVELDGFENDPKQEQLASACGERVSDLVKLIAGEHIANHMKISIYNYSEDGGAVTIAFYGNNFERNADGKVPLNQNRPEEMASYLAGFFAGVAHIKKIPYKRENEDPLSVQFDSLAEMAQVINALTPEQDKRIDLTGLLGK